MIEVTGEVLDLVIQGRVTGVIDVRIQGLQCNLCVECFSEHQVGYKVRGYRGYWCENTGITV